jgi:hypothetical protein
VATAKVGLPEIRVCVVSWSKLKDRCVKSRTRCVLSFQLASGLGLIVLSVLAWRMRCCSSRMSFVLVTSRMGFVLFCLVGVCLMLLHVPSGHVLTFLLLFLVSLPASLAGSLPR